MIFSMALDGHSFGTNLTSSQCEEPPEYFPILYGLTQPKVEQDQKIQDKKHRHLQNLSSMALLSWRSSMDEC